MNEHVPAPADGTVALGRLSDAELAHLRRCHACRAAWFHAGAWKAGCSDPRAGALASRSLGDADAQTAEVRDHVSKCLACALERRAWEACEASRATPTPALTRRLRAALREKSMLR